MYSVDYRLTTSGKINVRWLLNMSETAGSKKPSTNNCWGISIVSVTRLLKSCKHMQIGAFQLSSVHCDLYLNAEMYFKHGVRYIADSCSTTLCHIRLFHWRDPKNTTTRFIFLLCSRASVLTHVTVNHPCLIVTCCAKSNPKCFYTCALQTDKSCMETDVPRT